jgi:undecaprenyl-diphosphatase
MPLLFLISLAVAQGLTEFLPVSSSGHLGIIWDVFGHDSAGAPLIAPERELLIDVALHLGTLGALLIYFRREVARLALAAPGLLRGKPDAEGRLLGHLLLATLPILPAGLALSRIDPDSWRHLPVIIPCLIGFGILLGLADLRPQTRHMAELGWRGALKIGIAQILALVPGVSRSGITITAGRFLGLSRLEAARFAMLMGIPATAAAGLDAVLKLAEAGDGLVRDAAIGVLVSGVVGLAAIHVMMRWLQTRSYLPFVIYRVVLGLALLAWLAFS